MASTERVFWRRRQIFSEQRQPPRQENPYFPEKRRPEQDRRRVHVASLVIFSILGVGLLYALFFSPIFRVDTITVEGNRFLRTDAVTQKVQSFLATKIAWVIPRRTLTLLSSNSLKHYLLQSFGTQQAIDDLRVEKHFPSRIHIVVKERTPNLVYENGGVRYLVDRAGIITKPVETSEHLDPTFPRLVDQTTRTLAVGSHAIGSTLIDALFSAQQQLRDRTDIPVDFFYLPPVDCVKFVAQPEEGSALANTNVNGTTVNANTNQTANTNTNRSSLNINAQTANTNSNSGQGNLNVNATLPPPCDKNAEVLKTLNLRVKTTEGWEIYLRTDDSISTQVTRLLRVLNERHLDRTKLSYIDLRFGESVIIK